MSSLVCGSFRKSSLLAAPVLCASMKCPTKLPGYPKRGVNCCSAISARAGGHFASHSLSTHPMPRTPVRARPLQHLEVTAMRRVIVRDLVPRSSVRAGPLQHLEVPAVCRIRTRLLVPRAAVRAHPLKHSKVPAIRRIRARPLVPRAPVRAQPL